MCSKPNFKKGFSIVHMNARSVRNKMSNLKKELGSSYIDIILFSETWLDEFDEI